MGSTKLVENVKIIETHHFLDRWKERVRHKYEPTRAHKRVYRSIERGKNRIRTNLKLGMMTPIRWKGRPYFVLGTTEVAKDGVGGSYILRTILTEEQAINMGWHYNANCNS